MSTYLALMTVLSGLAIIIAIFAWCESQRIVDLLDDDENTGGNP